MCFYPFRLFFVPTPTIDIEPGKENHRTNSVRWFWQGHKDLNPEPTVLETAALPIELYPYVFYSKRNETLALWWAFRDSNPGLSGYEPEALTN